ncbi:DUF6247 family protein [Amycolatopsis sp. NBC_01286]|uniref:DUF6247 family protein n=1 Tax=Amycolatopsis sp. NBC_01286 TaxID=2903560 RepID=UPI002E0D3367|nr:DUF6247 family protein [Amycolatopsis sp. NBC_01286]
MSTAAMEPEPEFGTSTSPSAIRSALLPEDVAEFDRDYEHAFDVARRDLSLTDLVETLASWSRVARSTQADPAAHRRMLQAADKTLQTGQAPAGSRSWSKFKTELGLQ